MRLLGSTKHIHIVEKLSKSLTEKNIQFQAESKENLDWGSDDYGTITWTFWVLDENELPVARLILWKILQENHDVNEFKPNIEPEPIPQKPIESKKPFPYICAIFACLLITLFCLDSLTHLTGYGRPKGPETSWNHSLIRSSLLFDYPEAIHSLETDPNQTYLKPFFPGFLPLLEMCHGNIQNTWNLFLLVPKCEKIQQGEVWRLFTPSFLHEDIFHLLFNLCWLVLLGPPLERLFRPFPFLLFTLVAAFFSNSAQYLVTGSQFLGYSGIIAAYAGYIFHYTRQHASSSLDHLYEQSRFLLWLILFFAFFAVAEALCWYFFSYRFPFSIANTAHTVGFLFGYLVAKLKIH